MTAVGDGRVRAYVPPPLPPDPPLRLDELYGQLEEANRALGRLDGVTSILPNAPLFLYMYVRKEALLSSQTTQTLVQHSTTPPLDSCENRPTIFCVGCPLANGW